MATKLRLVSSITILFFSFYVTAQNKYWQLEPAKGGDMEDVSERFGVRQGKLLSVQENLLKDRLRPLALSQGGTQTITFPDKEGNPQVFRVREAPVLSPELAKRYPQIKSYFGQAVGDGTLHIRFSVSHRGVQGMIVGDAERGATFLQKLKNGRYVLYARNEISDLATDFVCYTQAGTALSETRMAKLVDGQELRKFRLAVSATGEYTDYHGGTVADALAAINATVTRVNEVFETDLGVTLELVSNTDAVIFTDPDTDPYSGNLNAQAQNTLTDVIGADNYDIGHLFQAGDADGNAGFIGSVCVDNRKGSAYASSPNPEGDLFDLDFVAHEMGHQFGANHTWSFESEGTQVQVEPASGSTIMGYAGITGINNVATNGDDYFHYVSIVQIQDFLETIDCGEIIPLTNNPPMIVPTGNFVIPRSTAFALTAEASDPDADDVLTYAWEQIDDGVVTQASFGPGNPAGANFRSQLPSINPTRYFPALTRVLQGQLTQTDPTIGSAWETVSDVGRDMHFAVTVRDNVFGGGQVSSDLVTVAVSGSAGPFLVTSQATAETYTAGSEQEITWSVANTDLAPVNAATVSILLSTDGGLSFPTVLASNIVNDGRHQVVVPGLPTAEARVMVVADNNIFYAVNTSDFSIEASEVVLQFDALEYEVCQPNSVMVEFNYETYLGFTEEVTFTATDAPTGLDITFLPETATADTPVQMTFDQTGTVSEGIYPITITATSTTVTKEIVLDLAIYDADFPELTLVSPMDGQMDVSATATLEWTDDPLATAYDVEIATDATFTQLVETATVRSNTFIPAGLENNGTYFWRVRAENICGTGNFSTAFQFSTIQFNCMERVAENVPIAISPIGTPTITSRIAFFEDLPVADVNVKLDVDHSFLADLVVNLTSPAGTTVTLISNSCGELANIKATFDDEAPNFDCTGTPAISGRVKPLGDLGAFRGESILGEWTLTIADNAASDGGSLNSFSLEICVEGEFRPDADKDGVFDDGNDLCLDTPFGAEVNASGCAIYRLPRDNFAVLAESTSCRGNADGTLTVEAVLPLDYTIAVEGPGVMVTDNFTSGFTLDNLAPGAYTLCIDGSDDILDYERQCFEVMIQEPDPLNVTSQVSLETRQVSLRMAGGAEYWITLNGTSFRTIDSELVLDLKQGTNSLKVDTGRSCQGVYEETFYVGKGPLVYPNPFDGEIHILTAVPSGRMHWKIWSASGQLVASEAIGVSGTEALIDLSYLPKGIYLLQVETDSFRKSSKIIKR